MALGNRRPIRIRQGETVRETWTFSTWTITDARMQIRKRGANAGTPPLLDLTTDVAFTIAEDGASVQLVITADQTKLLPAGRLVCDAFVTTTSGDHKPVFACPFIVDQAVTR